MQATNKLKGLIISSAILLLVFLIVGLAGYFSPLKSHLRRAERALSEGNYEAALKEYELALTASPENWDVKVQIAEVQMEMKEYKTAEASLTALLAKDEARGKSLYPLLAKINLALAKQVREKDPAGSAIIGYLERAYLFDSSDSEIKKMLAEETFSKSWQMPPSLAADTIKKAVELDPKPAYKVGLAVVYLRQQNKAEFDRLVDAFSEEELKDPDTRQKLVRTFANLAAGLINYEPTGQASEAERKEWLAQGLKLFPDSPSLLLEKLRILTLAGDKTGMKQLLGDPALSNFNRELLEGYVDPGKFIKKKQEYQLEYLVNGGNSGPRVFNTEQGPMLVWTENRLEGGRIMTLNLNTGHKQQLLQVNGSVNYVQMGSKGQLIYASIKPGPPREYSQEQVYLRNSHGTKELSVFYNGPMFLPRISPDGSRAAYLSGQEVAILDLESGQEKKFQLPGSTVIQLVWSGDSEKLLLIEMSPGQTNVGTARVIDVSGKELLSFTTKPGLAPIGWTADGRVLGIVQPERTYFAGELAPEPVVLEGPDYEPQPLISPQQAELINTYFRSWDNGNLVFEMTVPQKTWSVETWLLADGNEIPFVVCKQGSFIGWAGPDRLVFLTGYMDVPRALHGDNPGAQPLKISVITLAD